MRTSIVETIITTISSRIVPESSHHNSAVTRIDLNLLSGDTPSTDLSALDKALVEYVKYNTGKDKSNAVYAQHVLKKNLAGLAAQLTFCQADTNQSFVDEKAALKSELKSRLAASGVSVSLSPAKESNISDQIGDIIGIVKEDYYDVFEGGLAKYIQFYKELGLILAEMASLIKDGADEGKIKYDYKTLHDKLDTLLKKYKDPNGNPNGKLAQLYPVDFSQNTTEADARKWAKDMGLPTSSVIKNASGTYYVAIDLGPLENMKKNIQYPHDSNKELTNTEYQAWLTGFNAQEEQIKTTISSLTGRFSNANSIYDNVVKILSSTISSLADMSKRYFSI